MGKILWIIIIFLVIGGFIIKSSLDTDFSETDDRKSFAKEFFSWLLQVGKSTKNTVGYAIGRSSDSRNCASQRSDRRRCVGISGVKYSHHASVHKAHVSHVNRYID